MTNTPTAPSPPPNMPTYRFRAAREAFEIAGKDYADYIERHTAELVAKGHLTETEAQRSLSEALIRNDGD